MKRFITLMMLCMITNSYAEGICNYSKQRVNAVVCFGPAILKDTAVNGNIKVVGPLTAINVQAKSLSVTGSADVQNTDVAGTVDITGYLEATNSHFFSSMHIQADKLLLNHTVIGGDIQMDSAVSKPIITMKCGTAASGTVTFGGMAGTVQVSDDSSFPGKIKNGVMEFIRSKC